MDIRDYNVAKMLIDEIESDQFEQRRIDEYKAYKVAEGGQRAYVLEALKKLFPKSWDTMRVSDVSISNKVLSKVAKSYKESPKRVFGNQTDDINELLDKSHFDSVMSEFDRDYNRQRYALLWVNEIDDEPQFHSLKGFESFVKINPKTGKLEAVVINYPDTTVTANSSSTGDNLEQVLSESQDDTSAQSKIYAMWTAEHHSVWQVQSVKGTKGVRKQLSKVVIEGNELERNDLGILPFVYKTCSSSPDLPFLNQLTDQSIMYNILKSDELTSCAIQGYAQLVVSLPEDMSMETINGGMTTAIHLPLVEGADNQADAKYINPNPDLQGMRETIDSYARDVLDEHGITTQSSKSGNSAYSSGLERLIANADVSDKIRSNQMIYADVEESVKDILTAYGYLRQTDEPYNVIYEKPKVMISDAETLANIEKRLNLGLITKLEALQIIDPNLSDDAAQDKLDLINEEKQNNINTFMGGFSGQESNQAATIEPEQDQE